MVTTEPMAPMNPMLPMTQMPALPPPTEPDLIGNRNFWTTYDWSTRGEEWSAEWGGSDSLWFATLYPRLRAFLPARHVLEIGPGFGRVTHYLRPWCEQMTLVDLVDRSAEHCRARFAGSPSVACVVNDGKSLEMIPDGSIDLVFSWEALVFAEHDTVREYLRQLARKLAPGGIGLLHHSNLGEYAGGHTGAGLPKDLSSDLYAGRRASMSAEKFRADCATLGLRCMAQEIVSARDNGVWTDAISLFTRDPGGLDGGRAAGAARVEYRHDWAVEKANARRMMELYRKPRDVG